MCVCVCSPVLCRDLVLVQPPPAASPRVMVINTLQTSPSLSTELQGQLVALHTGMHKQRYENTHRNVLMYCIHSQKHAHTHARTHTQECGHALSHTDIHAPTHIQECAHTWGPHTHTHTHTHVLPECFIHSDMHPGIIPLPLRVDELSALFWDKLQSLLFCMHWGCLYVCVRLCV